MHLNEQQQICAAQENPFITNKPHLQGQVMGWVMTYFFEPETDFSDPKNVTLLKELYVSTLLYLQTRDMDVTDANIAKCREEILAFHKNGNSDSTPEPNTSVQNATPGSTAKTDSCTSKKLRVPKKYVVYGVVIVLALVIAKLTVSLFKPQNQ
jgi:hypothetical protein